MSRITNKKSNFFDFSERFLEFCNYLLETEQFKNHSGIGEFFGFSRNGMSLIVNRKNNISLPSVQLVLQKYPKLNADWLILGKGTMLSDHDNGKETAGDEPQKMMELNYLFEKVSLLESIINDKDALLRRDQEYITILKEENAKLKQTLKRSESGKSGLG